MYSKYERRTDTRTYEDRRKLYEGVSALQECKSARVCSVFPLDQPQLATHSHALKKELENL